MAIDPEAFSYITKCLGELGKMVMVLECGYHVKSINKSMEAVVRTLFKE